MYLYLIREKRQASEGPGRLLGDGVVPASQLLCPTWPLGVPTSSVTRSRVTVLRGSPGKPPQEAGRGVNLLAFCQDRGLRHCTYCRPPPQTVAGVGPSNRGPPSCGAGNAQTRHPAARRMSRSSKVRGSRPRRGPGAS